MNEHETRMCLGLEGEALGRALDTALNKTKRDVMRFAGQVDQFGLDSRRKDDKAKMDMTRNCPRPIKKIRGPLFDDKQEVLP